MRNARNGFLTLTATALLAAGLAACGDDKSDSGSGGSGGYGNRPESTAKPASTAAAASSGGAEETDKVAIASFKFKPADIKVAKGSKVTWSNSDDAPHTATASDPDQKAMFDSGTIKKGESKSVTFDTAGSYKYLCLFHPFMTGTVTVE